MMADLSRPKRIVVMAGGTGGHVYPALSIADVLTQNHMQVYWLGTKHGIESRLVTAYPRYEIPALPWMGRSVFRRCCLLVQGVYVLLKVWWIFLRIKPDLVLGMGGYVSAPGGLVACLMRKKLVIHEQNAVCGLANRYLAKWTAHRLCAYPDVFGHLPAHRVGNPVRPTITRMVPRRVLLHAPYRVLVLGGSHGAHAINAVMPAVVSALAQEGISITVWHQTGYTDVDWVRARYAPPHRVMPFIEEMDAAYAWADLVLCRSGAMTCAELMCVGLPSILVPLPTAANNHQWHNAQFLVQAGGACVLAQAGLSVSAVVQQIKALVQDRDKALIMGKKARQACTVHAAEAIAQYINSLV